MTTAPVTSPDVTVRNASITRLLAAGAVAGPLFVTATLVQAATREGFDPVVHPLSMLSLSELGWIHIANFVIAGLLALAGAFGLRAALTEGPGRVWGPRLFAVYGFALVWAGVFTADPAFGYPIGTPEGAPAELSWHGVLHSFAPAGASLSLVVACIVFARRYAREGRGLWAGVCVAAAVLDLGLTGASFALADYRFMFAGGAVIWVWAAAVCFDALRRNR
ncbi:DUF998 domain-containing protein [Glycomyces paridis]|uniref:DUF998 domain-containing protein n=1 Tax=Glycomyces paridis TaxID=2126555 RepID=A0A4S8PEP1_9ACTN|nr:DUF998 domain-containing protein [Glycomyces paridis]THV26769.1 DUF998 domain-containing protein [Glycomyces paridis]